VPRAELEGDMATRNGPAGALDVPSLRKLTAIVSKSKTCLIFINRSEKMA